MAGYVGGNNIYLAMERGEIQGRCGGLISSIKSTRPDWFPQHKINVPIQIAERRNPLFTNVPAVGEFAKDARTKNILKLVLSPLKMGRPILAPPGVPQARVAALRAAFHAAMHDAGFIAQAEKQHLEIGEVSGGDVAQVLDNAFAMPPDIAEAASAAMHAGGTDN